MTESRKTERHLLRSLHQSTKRDYFARMNAEKPLCMRTAKEYAKEYWDGDRKYGYGGYRYDGRWRPMAQSLIELYGLTEASSVLDLGCGKAHLLFELQKLLPGLRVKGVDFSAYALSSVPEALSSRVEEMDLRQTPWPFENDEFDLALSLNVFHNFPLRELTEAIREMQRVARQKYLVVESYRNEEELTQLQCWALTCASFFHVKDWEYLLETQGYTGDYEFIFFE